jgi:hypothetical protein
MKKGTWIILIFVIVVVLIVFGPGWTLSSIANSVFNIDPVAWLLGTIALACLALSSLVSDSGNDGAGRLFLAFIVFGFAWLLWFIFQGPIMLNSLYKNTGYIESDLISQNNIRDVPYTVAITNITGTNPESRTGPGDLDFVEGVWISSIDPKGVWNAISMPTQGFFLYDPRSKDKVVTISQEMPYAEGGLFFNSSTYFVRSKKFFAEFTEILYVRVNDTDEVVGVMSLIKRRGISRWPYVANVLVVHGDGQYEMLSVIQAEADPRLVNIALKPEWLVKKEVEAYGYRYGVIKGVFSKTGRIQIQKSSVNDENSPPFHLNTPNGYFWYAPFSPLRSESLTGIAMTSSHDVDGPVYVWTLPKGQAYVGSDFMVATIEGKHKQYAWYRETEDSKCGNMTVLEMVPVVKSENGENKLYFLGYVSTAPKSVDVLFYTIIDPETGVVYEDLQTADQVNFWLQNGEYDLMPIGEYEMTQPAVGTPEVSCVEVSSEGLEEKDTQDLMEIIFKVIYELGRRADK